MAIIDLKHMLSELKVREAMRRIAVSIRADTTIEQAIRCAIKHKITAILVTDKNMEPLGVVSKTDIMSAYYAGIALDSPAELIMTSPPIFCELDGTLDHVLRTMCRNRIHRVYVRNEERGPATGIISYPDLVGLLYRYCHKCEKSIQRKMLQGNADSSELLRVRDVMTPTVKMMDVNETLAGVMEELSAHRFGAILLSWSGIPAGVISKTDLILAYKHGVPVSARANSIMRTPLRSCSETEELAGVIRHMIFCDIRRFFVYRGDPDDVVGVLSLTDAAQARSGSCRACMPSRIEVL
ncbi:MAG: cyclic nucleotide-binding/CBS domain-containing protein [Syntrophobacteraceae bacterium]